MLVSRNWLQNYIKEPLPAAEVISDALIMHAFEVEGVKKTEAGDDYTFDVKILPDRASSCLSHRGIAREIAAILNLTFIEKPDTLSGITANTSDDLKVTIANPKLCKRYSALRISGVKAESSPEGLRVMLESVGQKSINTIVDITNFVMFSMGQPMHAFDAAKMGKYINVAQIDSEQKFLALDNKEYTLPAGTLCIIDADAKATTQGTVLGVAGIKGGMAAAIDATTNTIILESASFDAAKIRKTAQTIGLRTDASKRFENALAAGFTTMALSYAAEFIQKLNPGAKIELLVDVYPKPEPIYKVGVSTKEASDLLGVEVSAKDISGIFDRFGFSYTEVAPTQTMLAAVESVIDVPYVRGASVLYDAPRAFDCSSLVAWSLVQAGISVPRMSVDQYIYAYQVSRGDLRAGDLVFANTGSGTIYFESKEFLKGTKVGHGVDHVGIYIGKDEAGADIIIHATASQGKVVKEKLDDAVMFKNIVGYGRVLSLADQSRFVVEIPFERVDLRRKENLIEEIGRIYGYEHIPEKTLVTGAHPAIDREYFYPELIRSKLADLGFSEVFTYAFTDKGEVEVENPMAADKGFLRPNIADGMAKSLEMNVRNADLLSLSVVKQFEIGKVFNAQGEHLSCAIAVGTSNAKKGFSAQTEVEAALAAIGIMATVTGDKRIAMTEFDLGAFIATASASTELPPAYKSSALFKTISAYPFAVRDIAVFVPGGMVENDPLGQLIQANASNILVHAKRFDAFAKEGKTSYAYRLVFQSEDHTLSEAELTDAMAKINTAIAQQAGWEVR